MPFPAGLTLVTVTCQFDAPPDGGGAGRVRFDAPYPLVGATDNAIVPPFTVTAEIDETGLATVELPANDDPQWAPVGWAYRVTVSPSAGPAFRGTAQFPHGSASAELSDVFQPDGAAEAGATYATLAQLAAVQADLDAAETEIDEKLPLTGGALSGDLAVDGAVLSVEGEPGTFRQMHFRSGPDVGDARWSIHVDNSAEAGGNAGSDWRLVRHDDAGDALDAPIGVDRATGAVTLSGQLAVTGAIQSAAMTVNGNLTVQDDDIPSKSYGLRTSGAGLDFDAGGADLHVSNWSGVAGTGTQHNYLRLESGAPLAHGIGRWLFAAGAFDGSGVADLDPSTGVAAVGAKNGLTNIRLCGYKASGGAPSAGDWTTGDLIIDSAGTWHLCTAGGTPGVWT